MKLSAAIDQHHRNVWSQRPDGDQDYSRALRVLGALGDTDVTAVSWSAVEALFDSQGYSAATRNRYASVLSSLGVPVKFQKVIESERRVLSTAQLEALDAQVRAQKSGPCKAMYALLRDTGARGPRELQRINPADIDWDERILELESHKGGHRMRKVPLSDIAYNALLWMHHEGYPWPSRGSWRNFWLKVRLDDQNRPYDLRHTFCTRLLDADMPPAVVMRIMGHTNLERTLSYNHQRASAIEGVRQALNGFQGSPDRRPVRQSSSS